MTAAANAAADIIEGSFRVVATRELRKSPNRQRAAARIAFWNLALVACLIAAPLVL